MKRAFKSMVCYGRLVVFHRIFITCCPPTSSARALLAGGAGGWGGQSLTVAGSCLRPARLGLFSIAMGGIFQHSLDSADGFGCPNVIYSPRQAYGGGRFVGGFDLIVRLD